MILVLIADLVKRVFDIFAGAAKISGKLWAIPGREGQG